MNIKVKIKESIYAIRSVAVNAPAVFIFILAAGISQLFYKYIPNAIQLNILFSFSVILLCIDELKIASARMKTAVFCLQFAGIAAIYFVNLFTLNRNIEHGCIALTYLYCISALIVFFPKQEFLNEFKLRFIHLLISLLFFAAVYLTLFITVFLINAIFNLNIVFTESIIFRITNSAATVTALTVFLLYRSKPLVHSKFFTLMFEKLLPVLLPPLGVLGLIYIAKYILFPHSTDTEGLSWYYPVITLIILCLFMIRHFENRSPIVRTLFGILGIAALGFIASLLRYRAVNPHRWSSIGFTHSDTSPLYEIAVNGLLALYFFSAAIHDKNITALFRKTMALITLLLFLPGVGFYTYSHFETKEALKERNDLAAFILKRQEDKNTLPKPEYLYYSYSPDDERIDGSGARIIDTTDYSAVLLGVELKLEAIPAPFTPSQAKCRYRQFLFALTPDGKSVTITNMETDESEVLDFYTRIKADDSDMSIKKYSNTFIFENKSLKMIIQSASYHENHNARLHFDVYIKKTF
ncbi:MAG: hypothetical protein ACTTH7_10005 [Treponema sp.]